VVAGLDKQYKVKYNTVTLKEDTMFLQIEQVTNGFILEYDGSKLVFNHPHEITAWMQRAFPIEEQKFHGLQVSQIPEGQVINFIRAIRNIYGSDVMHLKRAKDIADAVRDMGVQTLPELGADDTRVLRNDLDNIGVTVLN
jgi:hypothetical protein